MLNVLVALYAPMGQAPSCFTEKEFKDAESMDPSPSVMTSAGTNKLTAEFPFSGTTSGLRQEFNRHAKGESLHVPETALFQASAADLHPGLGSGCLFLLNIPTMDRDTKLINELNLAEATDFGRAHGIGAWCQGPAGPAHAAFLPSGMYAPGLIQMMMWNDAMRTIWAREFLG